MKVLVTGGAGYIGSHTCLELLKAGYQVVVVDNLSNSKETSLIRVQEICARSLEFYPVDLRHRSSLENVFAAHSIEAVVHFAGLKAVGESVSIPLAYYDNNVSGTVVLCQTMAKFGVKNLVFSSSATVYGDPQIFPIREDFPRSATNPYGRSKLMIEDILFDLQRAEPDWNIILLRYFNPVGAHESGWIGEDPNGIPNNLLPYVAQVAVGRWPFVRVFGNDYPTPDGTGIRDYIHVVDLSLGHLKALEKLTQNPGIQAYNLGTGHGTSVLQVLSAFEKACGKSIPYQIFERRPGDAAVSYADPGKAERELGWRATRDIETMCADIWRWQSKNPNGYQETPSSL